MEVTLKSIHLRGLPPSWFIGGVVLLLSIGGISFLPTAQGMPQEGARGVSQSYEESHTERLGSRQNSAESLPEWAEPRTEGSGFGASSHQEGVSTHAPPPPPEDPPQLPVDGGLSLLAAAGAGYALRKLRKEGEDE